MRTSLKVVVLKICYFSSLNPALRVQLIATMCVQVSNYVCFCLFLQMKSTEVDQGLFTDSYCKVCSAQLISESQRVAHYEVMTPPHIASHDSDALHSLGVNDRIWIKLFWLCPQRQLADLYT